MRKVGRPKADQRLTEEGEAMMVSQAVARYVDLKKEFPSVSELTNFVKANFGLEISYKRVWNLMKSSSSLQFYVDQTFAQALTPRVLMHLFEQTKTNYKATELWLKYIAAPEHVASLTDERKVTIELISQPQNEPSLSTYDIVD